MTDLEELLHDLAASEQWNSVAAGDPASRAVSLVRRRNRRRVLVASALACAVAVTGGVGAAHRRTQDGPVSEPARDTPVAFEGVSAKAPAGWALSMLSTPDSPSAVACIGPAAVTWTPEPDPTHYSPFCVGGVMITRRVASLPSFMGHVPSQAQAARPSCASFGLRQRPSSEDTPRVGPSDAKPVEVGTNIRIGGRRFVSVSSWMPCNPPGTAMLEMSAFIAWDAPQTRVTLNAASPLSDDVKAVLHSIRIDDRPFSEPSTPTSTTYAVQDHGVTVTLPPWWGTWGPGGAECLGQAVEHSDLASATCPLNGLLVRGARFFAGTGVAGQMGPATPDPSSPLGYRGSAKKAEHDVRPGCERLTQLGLSNDPSVGQRVLVDEGERPVAGTKAQYRAWRTTCGDGTAFVWRRWWLPAERTMFDSYDMPGGLTPEFIDDMLVHARLTN